MLNIFYLSISYWFASTTSAYEQQKRHAAQIFKVESARGNFRDTLVASLNLKVGCFSLLFSTFNSHSFALSRKRNSSFIISARVFCFCFL